MENPLLGLGRKNDKLIKLHYSLQIEIYKEDCRTFDYLILCYTFCSIAYKLFWYIWWYIQSEKFINEIEDTIEDVILDAFSIAIWLFGFFISLQSVLAYNLMKSKDIKKSAKRVLMYLVLQTCYFLISGGLITAASFKKFNRMSERVTVVAVNLTAIIGVVFLTLYFYSKKYGLSEEIQKFDTTTGKKNAAYRKVSSILF
jgi:hypothetical protein